MSVPVLSKNASDFDSIRNSQNPSKDNISENVIKKPRGSLKEPK